ncbi:thioesterase family protein [Pontibaca methylaminivorans]|uniref:Thioesterase superfamily n=1 Tax=Pontibaca methylaminivorans TaxID=515897 RepID=A0A1R3WGG8_9RHOB|nr:thioesterase family protein [Pontibaca methylaminivorans]SIT76506.1 Thioesterase superfamily [Pontibaca methylaminivorans]
MTPGLTIGATASHAMTVRESHLVPALFPETRPFADMPPVFATAQMVALVEWACVEQLRPFYESGEQSVGVHVDVDHRAPTLPGQTVTVESEVEDIDGRFIWFRVNARDGANEICRGRHRRALIRRAEFDARLARQGASLGLED